MENLTQTLGVVKPNVNPAPIPGYKIVVFKEKRGAKKFHRILNEEDRPVKAPIFSRETYISYAVNTDPTLKFEQSTEVTLPAQHKHFTLGCRAYFRISNPKQLTVRFKEDPVRLIWDEIKNQCTKNIKKSNIKIEDVKFRFREVELKILTPESLGNVKIIAEEYGIDIEKIVLDYILPEGELEVDIERDKHKKEMEIGALKKEKSRAEREEKTEAKEHELELNRMENDTKIRNQISEQFVVAVKQLAEQINNPENFKKSAIVFKEVMEDYFTNPRQLGNPQDTSGRNEMKQALAIGEEGPFKDVRNILLDIIGDIKGSSCNTYEKKEILSITTRLLSETYHEKEADLNMFEEYLKQLDKFALEQRTIFTRDRMERIKECKTKFEEIKSQSQAE